MGWRLGALVGPAGCRPVFAALRRPLQIMAEHAPADGTGRFSAFGTPDARASVIFEDRHACFGAAAPRLHLSEQGLFVHSRRAGSLGRSSSRCHAWREGFVVLAVKPRSVTTWLSLSGRSMASMRSTLSRIFSPSLELSFIQLVINDQSSQLSARNSSLPNSTAASFATNNHIDVRFVGTEDFVRIVDLASADVRSCACSITCGSSSSFSSIRARIRGLCGAVTCVLLPRFEQVAVPAGVIADAQQQFFHFTQHLLRIRPCDGCASSRCTAGSSAG